MEERNNSNLENTELESGASVESTANDSASVEPKTATKKALPKLPIILGAVSF